VGPGKKKMREKVEKNPGGLFWKTRGKGYKELKITELTGAVKKKERK